MSLWKNNEAFSQLVPLVLAIVICFSILFIGIFVNGKINSALTDGYPNNTATGSITATTIYWQNGTNSYQYRNITLPAKCSVGNLDSALTYIKISANASHPITFDFDINGHPVNRTTAVAKGTTATILLSKLVAAGNVSTTDTNLNFKFKVNSTLNNVRINYGTTSTNYYLSSDLRTSMQNNTVDSMNNINTNMDSSVGIVQVVVIITILASAIGAIFLFTKLRQ